jgi:hypothetical protein
MTDAATATTTSQRRLVGFTQAPITKLIPAFRDGLAPIDIRKDLDGGYTVYYDPRAYDHDAVCVILMALGIPLPADAAEQGAAAVRRAAGLAAADIAAHPGCHTVAAPVWGGTVLTIREPAWCVRSHRTAPACGEHPDDITHASDETPAEITLPDGTRMTLFSGWISSNPFSTHQPEPCASIDLPNGVTHEYDARGLAQLAVELRAAAHRVGVLRDRLLDATSTARGVNA